MFLIEICKKLLHLNIVFNVGSAWYRLGLPIGIQTEAVGIIPRSARYVAPSLRVSKGSIPIMKFEKALPCP